MCGISGVITKSISADSPAELQAIVRSQQSRGPDSVGYLRRNMRDGRTLWLAHNRLSIIDLSTGANQPMVTEDGRYAMVFNGAIYNYLELRLELEALGWRFRTTSDTEVLLLAYAQWGKMAFSRFVGMFAVAIHDNLKDELIIARDRFGVKPLYYQETAHEFWFASTPGAIAKSNALEPELEYVTRGIRLKYYEDETGISPFKGLCALPPGHIGVRLSASASFQLQKYFDLDAFSASETERLASVNIATATEELHALLSDATRIRLRADVPVGLSLSGGVDSTTIAALCSASGTPLTGFSFGDPSDKSSEADLVTLLSDQLRSNVVFVAPARGADAASLFWKTMRAQGAPIPHTSQMAQFAVFSAAREHGIKVMLGGQGGDEAFMGYRKYFLYQFRHVVAQRKWAEAPALLGTVLQVLPAVAAKAHLFWRERGRYQKGGDGLGTSLRLPPLQFSPSPGIGLGQDPAIRQALDVTRYSLPSLLRYEDRNSMGNSIESRLPFLDHRVIGFGLGLPTIYKLRHGMGKYALRMAMKGRVPDAILFNRDKRGFDTRHADWIVDGVGEAIRQGLLLHRRAAEAFLPSGTNIDIYFSDAALGKIGSRFAEATTLLWLLDPTLDSYPD
jgi:asparagine synthase (glutamine-hydrolysing)